MCVFYRVEQKVPMSVFVDSVDGISDETVYFYACAYKDLVKKIHAAFSEKNKDLRTDPWIAAVKTNAHISFTVRGILEPVSSCSMSSVFENVPSRFSPEYTVGTYIDDKTKQCMQFIRVKLNRVSEKEPLAEHKQQQQQQQEEERDSPLAGLLLFFKLLALCLFALWCLWHITSLDPREIVSSINALTSSKSWTNVQSHPRQ